MDGPALLALQLVDSALDQVGHRRARLAERAGRDTAAAALADLQARIDAASGRAAEARVAIERAESEAADLGAKKERLERQLKSVISPREAEALMAEIAHLDSARSALDDDALAAMETEAEVDQELVELRALLPTVEAELAAAEGDLTAANAVLDAEVAELSLRREAAAAALSDADRVVYERARAQFGGVGVAALDGTRCSACHLDIPRADLDRMRALPAGEPGECPHCARLLVR